VKHHLDFEKPIAELQAKLEELKKHPETHSLDISYDEEVAIIEKKLEETRRQIFSNLSAWDRIKIARHPKRPFALDYLEGALTDFTELHGDRVYAEDRAVVGARATGLDARLGDHQQRPEVGPEGVVHLPESRVVADGRLRGGGRRGRWSGECRVHSPSIPSL